MPRRPDQIDPDAAGGERTGGGTRARGPSRVGLVVSTGVTAAIDVTPRASLTAAIPGARRLVRSYLRRHRQGPRPRAFVVGHRDAPSGTGVVPAVDPRVGGRLAAVATPAATGSRRVDPRLRARIVAELHDLLADRRVPPQRTRLVLRATQLLLRRGISIRADGSAFVVTGDIPAMWLRDSSAQVAPLLALAGVVPEVVDLVAAVLRTQIGQIGIDPRANAFNPEPNGMAIRHDFPGQSPWVFERKYAVDSLCAPLTLAWRLWQATGSLSHVDDAFQQAVRTIVSLWRLEQDHDADGFVLRRRLARRDDSLSNGGRGAPVGRTGMTWSGFRPSDDACRFGYHVPANAAASVALTRAADLLDLAGARDLAAEARRLGGELRQGILVHALVDLPGHGRGFAYEVDGLGHALLLDDANIPSLVSLPYLGFCSPDDPLYRPTRSWALSPGDPAWGRGRVVQGVGSTHTRPGWPWPLGILVEGLTAIDPEERESALRRAEATVQRDGLFHESVHPDDPRRFTRRWFGWADMLHVELVLRSAGLRC
jgi:meiotically up-regulated gene 157 (Mug157) protein